MNKREFIKSASLASLALSSISLSAKDKETYHPAKEKRIKNWAWHNPDAGESEDSMRQRYNLYREYGITGMFFEADHEPAFRTAKSCGLETHRWMWTMNRNDKDLLHAHPEWYAVNRKGESCSLKPPYVDYYRWLCPSREEVQNYLVELMKAEAAKDYVDGIHLDYVRYCDIFLPVNLWSKYNLIQLQEMPEFDYCYCEVCSSKYKALTGNNPADLKYPSESPSWQQFRLDSITNMVNKIALAVRQELHKKLTAAVFPTPFLAKRNVRQDWVNWQLDGVCPMIYHEFYNESVSWIKTATLDGIQTLKNSFPLYAGLFLPSFKDDHELEAGIRNAFSGGAKGVSLFSSPEEKHLKVLQAVVMKL